MTPSTDEFAQIKMEHEALVLINKGLEGKKLRDRRGKTKSSTDLTRTADYRDFIETLNDRVRIVQTVGCT